MTLNHEIFGEGHPILLLHGISLNLQVIRSFTEPAFEGLPGWKRIYVDLPGHGGSPPRDDIGSQDDLLAAVSEFVDEILGDEPFAIVGQSRGSIMARGLLHERSHQISGVVLLVPGGNPSSPRPLPPHDAVERDPESMADLPEDLAREFDGFLVSQRPEVVARRRSVVPSARQQFDAEQEARVKTAFEFSFLETEEKLVFDRPSLIVAGRQDRISGFLDSIDLMHRFPRATLAVLDAAGHGAAFERQELFTALMQDWLSRLAWSLSSAR